MNEYKLKLQNLLINIVEKEGTKGTILFVHGNSMSSKIWQRQFASEALAEYRLLAIDLPGHGDSAHSQDPDADYNVLFYAKILAEFISKTTSENVILAGHSLGGNVVIETLPLIDNCKGCVILASNLVNNAAQLPQTYQPNPDIAAFFTADYTQEDVLKFVDAVKGTTTPPLPAFVADDFRKTDKNCRSYLAKSVAENKLSDELGILQKVEFPILLTIGAEDKLINIDYFKNVSLKKWGNQVFEIEKAGHSAQFENADAFNISIASFCQSIFKS